MPIKKSEVKDFIYFSYKREDAKDLEVFKRELLNVTSLMSTPKDVVVDLAGANGITSPEIGILIRVLKAFQGTSRTLRMIASQDIQRIIASTNIEKVGHLVIYSDQQSFFAEMKKAGLSAT